MARERRRRVSEPEVLAALAHPVRLDLVNYLMAAGPATASVSARAVGDTPSNCSYHLRVLAKVGLVGEVPGDDGRERPWRALVTGFYTDPGDVGAAELDAISVQRDQRAVHDYLARREQMPPRWRTADLLSTYTLRLTAQELGELAARLDELIRPHLAATREETPGSALVHLGLHAFPLGSPQ